MNRFNINDKVWYYCPIYQMLIQVKIEEIQCENHYWINEFVGHAVYEDDLYESLEEFINYHKEFPLEKNENLNKNLRDRTNNFIYNKIFLKIENFEWTKQNLNNKLKRSLRKKYKKLTKPKKWYSREMLDKLLEAK